MHIHLKEDPDSRPHKVYTARQIPIHMRDKADMLIKELLEAKVIMPEPEPTDWVASAHFVPKHNGKLRLVTDFRGLNKLVKRPIHPFPAAKDIIRQIKPDSKVFAKIDAIHGYFQIRLDEESSKLCTFLLPSGKYRYLSAPMGCSASSDEYCRRTDEAFQGLDWLLKVVDDALIQAPSEEILMERLEIVLKRCREAGIKLSRSKLGWGSKIKFCGYIISDEGVQPDPQKIKGIKDFPTPENVSELRSFLGLANQICNFMSDLAQKTSKMRELLKKKNAFFWSEEHAKEFQQLKDIMCSDMIVHPFDPNLPTFLLTDASRLKGVGFALIQKDSEGRVRLIEANSISLNPAQKNYATIEIEGWAIRWAVEKCKFYLKGIEEATVITDHRPLLGVFNRQLQDVENARLARYREQLIDYNLKLEWAEGKSHMIADALSRAPVQEPEASGVEVLEIRTLMATFPPMQAIFDAAEEDEEYQQLIKAWKNGENISQNKHLAQYAGIWNQVSLQDGLLVVDSNRIIVPQGVRKVLLKTLHLPHVGADRTFENAKRFYFWPDMKNQIKILVDHCETCQKYMPSLQKEEMLSFPTDRPMQEVNLDLFHYSGKTWIIMVDSFSSFPFAKELRGTATEDVWKVLMDWFLDHGFPEKIRNDQGPQFRQKFKDFCAQFDIEWTPSSPYAPWANGAAEAGVKLVKGLIKKCSDNGEDFRLALLEMRNCIRSSGFSRAEAFYGRLLKAALPMLDKPVPDMEAFKAAKAREHEVIKKSYDKRAKNLPKLVIGDQVRIQNPHTKEWDSTGEIVSIEDGEFYRSYGIKSDEKFMQRNRRFLKRLANSNEDTDVSANEEKEEKKGIHSSSENQPAKTLRRSPRLAKINDGVPVLGLNRVG